jgi:V8-like Glu-specific endopeptidase
VLTAAGLFATGARGGATPSLAPGFEPYRQGSAVDAARQADGQVTAAGIFGERDDRVLVPDTTVAPHRSVTSLVALNAAGQPMWSCSGAMVSATAVLTAAHCVFDDRTGGYVPAIVVIPGRDGLTEPFGRATTTSYLVPNGWQQSRDYAFDFAVIALEGAPFGDATAPYLMPVSAPDEYFSRGTRRFASAGYPGDKLAGTQWYVAAPNMLLAGHMLSTRMDAAPGQSGSPIWPIEDGEPAYIIGILSNETPVSNQVLRLTANHLAAMTLYCEELGCTIPTRDLATQPPPSPTPTPTPRPPMPYELHIPKLARD